MSRHREMLRTLVRLGKTPDVIAVEVPMDLRNVEENLKDDWPIRKRFIAPLENYANETLRRVYASAVSKVTPDGPLRFDSESSCFIEGLRRDFSAFFVYDIDTERADADFQWSPSEVAQLAWERDRAAYVCWLLRLDPWRVFPHGPEVGPEPDEHLIESVRIHVDRLLDSARRAGPEVTCAPEVARYLQTLCHIDAVLSGRTDPAINGWFGNTLGFRCGEMVLPGGNSKKRAVPR